MNNLTPWDRRNAATPRDTLQADLLAAYRRHFEALKAETQQICYRADANMKIDIEAFEYFTDGCDNAFQIDAP